MVQCSDLEIEKEELERQRKFEMDNGAKYKELAYQRLNENADLTEKLHQLTSAHEILKVCATPSSFLPRQ